MKNFGKVVKLLFVFTFIQACYGFEDRGLSQNNPYDFFNISQEETDLLNNLNQVPKDDGITDEASTRNPEEGSTIQPLDEKSSEEAQSSEEISQPGSSTWYPNLDSSELTHSNEEQSALSSSEEHSTEHSDIYSNEDFNYVYRK